MEKETKKKRLKKEPIIARGNEIKVLPENEGSKPISKKLTQDGFGLAKQVKVLKNYTQPAVVYKLSHPLEKYEYIIVFSGKTGSGPQGVTVFGSDKDGKVIDMKPLVDKKNVLPLDIIKELGYTVGK